MSLKPFQRVYNIDEFMSADVTISSTKQWNKIGTLTVPAQQRIAFGFGGVGGGVDTRGQGYIKIWTQERDNLGTYPIDTGYIWGKIRLAISNNNETDVRVVLEERTERFNADQNDRTKCVLLGETRPMAKEDSKLLIYYYPDDALAEILDINGTNSQILIPVTVYQ